MIDPSDHQAAIYQKHLQQVYLKESKNMLKLIVLYKPWAKYLHQAHGCINHYGITQMHTHLSNYWVQNPNIMAYVKSCNTCMGYKGNYTKCPNCPNGYCKNVKRPFKVVYTDFITMPLSKGKHYILTVLDSFMRHLMAIPCTRYSTIDTACGIYQFFLHHQVILCIISSDHGTLLHKQSV